MRPGLGVGGTWIIPVRDDIDLFELALVLEMPEATVERLLPEGPPGGPFALKPVNELLRDLAKCGFTDWKESSLFGDLIAGRRHIDRGGCVRAAVKGQPLGSPIEIRTRHPRDAVDFDLKSFEAMCRRRGDPL